MEALLLKWIRGWLYTDGFSDDNPDPEYRIKISSSKDDKRGGNTEVPDVLETPDCINLFWRYIKISSHSRSLILNLRLCLY